MAPPSVSQSVVRLVRVLELFEREKRPLSSSQISEHLAAPRSSTAALLRSMLDMSILGMDRGTMTYLPTARFAQLAAWLNDRMVLAPVVMEAAKRLMAATLETVTLSSVSGLWAELISVERSTLPISFNVEPGARVKLFGSAVGTAYLTTLPNPSIKALYSRGLALADEFKPQESLETTLRRVSDARRMGYAFARGGFVAEASAISAAIPSSLALRPTLLTVAGPTQRMKGKHDLISQVLLDEIETLGLEQITETLAND
jgi:IclR family KDG regulon transcriptional repressor